MGALTIAFDTTIVGALALPWVLLVIHLFFFKGENRLGDVVEWVKTEQMQAVSGVLLFAMAYTLGCAVSRIAQDFFNDDDLHFQVGLQQFRMGTTEDRIIASVYCRFSHNHLLPSDMEIPEVRDKLATFEKQKTAGLCQHTLSWTQRHLYEKGDDDLIGTAGDLFSIQENALLFKGQDPTLRLRQLHDQIMVLRGAAFNGVVGLSLCLFAWCGQLRRQKPESRRRFAFALVPLVYLAVALLTIVHHVQERYPSDPPYMEFTILLLGLVGAWLVWKNPAEHAPKESGKSETGESGAGKQFWQPNRWPQLVLVSALLTATAILGWWSTEVFYSEQVIYSYDSQVTATTPKDTTASRKNTQDQN